ncbi:uncharacterized protein BJ212DRAFT_1376899 [Suillus subaureus]|uniref:Uncharacterized protein n=1 Tax=Suillus subaureus TaxID=48587 RepID=A0A9P7IXQ6_9AGAM|nr:uncharacterized protein BJ212DRAFT_1406166 [Suillus subaureus]XP_041189719.1 uncharacterized protein BJ212DRAFT_1376899 [Suillus subaureus]KAG1797294.1 hypothetical protein BJ212DRAFT_1406166 [Suillus subaureus]KAG1810939.1 hypothetical protein BJ212DRAFT_1376899 [Suillus subaureus]
MVHLLGKFSLGLRPSRDVGIVFLGVYGVYICYKYKPTVAGSSFINQYFLLLAWVYIFAILMVILIHHWNDYLAGSYILYRVYIKANYGQDQ